MNAKEEKTEGLQVYSQEKQKCQKCGGFDDVLVYGSSKLIGTICANCLSLLQEKTRKLVQNKEWEKLQKNEY